MRVADELKAMGFMAGNKRGAEQVSHAGWECPARAEPEPDQGLIEREIRFVPIQKSGQDAKRVKKSREVGFFRRHCGPFDFRGGPCVLSDVASMAPDGQSSAIEETALLEAACQGAQTRLRSEGRDAVLDSLEGFFTRGQLMSSETKQLEGGSHVAEYDAGNLVEVDGMILEQEFHGQERFSQHRNRGKPVEEQRAGLRLVHGH